MSERIYEYLGKQITPNVKRNKYSIVYLDAIKCLAAFLVVFYHFSYFKLDYGFVAEQMYIPNIERIFMSLAVCSVPLFFMVNGALMFYRQRSWAEVYLKAGKIIFLILIWSLVGFPSWFFKTMVVIYLIFPVLQWIRNKRRKFYYGICVCVFVFPFLYNLIVTIARAVNWSFIPDSYTITGAKTMYSVFYFIVGDLLYSRKKQLSQMWGVLSAVAGFSYVIWECCIFTNINQSIYDGVNHAFPTVGAVALSIGIWILLSNKSYRYTEKVVTIIGGYILSVYLMHSLWIKIIGYLFDVDKTIGLLGALIGSLLIMIICVLSGKILERIPVLCCLVKG